MRAVLYAAKSTEDRHGSIPTQLQDGRAMAKREGWEVVAEYAEEAQSAWKGDRGPQLAAALERAEREAPAVLCVQHSHRLARGDGKQARHLAEIYFWAIKRDIELRSVQDDSTFTNPLLVMALGERNAEDSRRKSLAVKAGMDRRRAKGLAHGGIRKFGFRFGEGGLVVVESERPTVERIFAQFLAGASQTRIARGLEADGVPTVKGGKWHQATVREILTNPVYAGMLRHGGEVVEGTHEAIVDRETWERAQELLAAKSRTGKGRGRPSAGRHLFRKGALRCGSCGESMVPRTTRKPDKPTYEAYCCYRRERLGPEGCGMMPVKRAEIDTAIYRYFEQVGLDVEATREQLAEARDRKLAEARGLLDQAEHERRRAEERLARVRRDYTDGAINAVDWADLRAELEPELAGAAAEVERLAVQVEEVEAWGELRDAELDTLAGLAEIRRALAGEIVEASGVEAVRAALSRLFEHFILHRGPVHVRPLAQIGELVIEPVVRPQAVKGYIDDLRYSAFDLRPIFRREPLYDAENNQGVGWVTPDLFFGPIRVAT